MMKLKYRRFGNRIIAEVQSNTIIIKNLDDAVDLLGNASYNGATGIIIRELHVVPDFFELSTRLAGEILQKFSNYRMKLAIIGDFSKYPSKSLRDFISESNRTGQIVFVRSPEEAKKILTV
jgi:hypothetical protein